MAKVFCSNCKYCKDYAFEFGYFGHDCTHPSNIKINTSSYGEFKYYDLTIESLNKGNNCKNYEPNLFERARIYIKTLRRVK
jgi:hypothetical protein